MMATEDFQYVIIHANDSYFGFDLYDDVEQASIFSNIHTKVNDFINGWMVSKVMPPWVGTYYDWIAFEKKVSKIKIPESVSYYDDNDKSSRKSDNSSSDNCEQTFSVTEQSNVNVKSQLRKRLEKQSKFILSSSDSDDDVDEEDQLKTNMDDDVDEEDQLKTNTDPICDWAIEGRCNQSIVPRKCQYSGGCNKYVHHLCTIEWATENGIEESGIATLCRQHHPEYQSKCNTKKHSKSDTKRSGYSVFSPKRDYREEANQYKDSSRHSRKSTGENFDRKLVHDTSKVGEKCIEGENSDVNSTAENDPNYDIFKSDLFEESLNKNLK
jgi:hypothetical protein